MRERSPPAMITLYGLLSIFTKCFSSTVLRLLFPRFKDLSTPIVLDMSLSTLSLASYTS